ncbi:MAG: SelB C-terminal domain-containing protein, partial [Gemmatimonadales bacterium]|nr:SelB C-terminal domain-containing protein [Gemmatimonadales bacterium]
TLLDRVGAVLEEAGLAPPTVDELGALLGEPTPEAALRMLAKAGQAERVTMDRYFATSALGRFQEAVEAIGREEGEIAPASLRDRLGISRKYLIPLLEWSDRKNLTRREGDRRILVSRG